MKLDPPVATSLHFQILGWSAWVPGVLTPEEWTQYLKEKKTNPERTAPDVSQISAMERRRMTPLSRMVTSVALQCCQKASIDSKSVDVIFASRHGEMNITIDLLNQILNEEPLSPAGFSNSVHHAAVARFSMTTKNQNRLRAVGGGDGSFGYGMLDALCLLNEKKGTPVLLIVADEALPAPFDALVPSKNISYAAAFLLGPQKPSDANGIRFSFLPKGQDEPGEGKNYSGVPAIDFLEWTLNESPQLKLRLSNRTWVWEK